MKTKKALLCFGAAATLFLYGCESKDNNGSSSADSSSSVITTAVQNTVPTSTILIPIYVSSSLTIGSCCASSSGIPLRLAL